MPSSPHPIRVAPYVWAVALLWSITLGASIAWQAHVGRGEAFGLAAAEARSAYDKDLLYRRWVAGHGGVYVPVTAETPPNPHLAVPERDVRTPEGRLLTLVNPAYMTRQVSELARREGKFQARVTSLRPLRPENAPDDWERKALLAIEAGASEVHEVADLDGVPQLRFMARMETEERCLPCHAHQGYAVGDVRGGITVAAPLAPHLAAARARLAVAAGWHAALWLVGLGAIGFGAVYARRRDRERAAHEAAAREAQARLSLALQGGGVGLWEWDLETNAVRWDDRVLPPFGRRPDELPDLSAIHALIHPDDLPENVEKTLACREGRSEIFDVEHRYRAADGSWRWVHAHGRAVERAADGRPRRFAGTNADVTDAHAADEERARLERELGQARRLEALGQLAGGVAHDLNNLLSPILGNAALALEGLPASDPLRQDLVEIQAAAERARDLTRRLLAFGRRQPLAIEPVDVGRLVTDLERMLARVLPANIALRLDLAPGLPAARADRSQLELALVNLAVNARDAMPGGGVLRIATAAARVDGTRAEALGVAPGAYVAIAVSDQGSGMTPATVERIFEPFFTTKPVGSGTGLGLPSVHGLVRQLGGAVEVESAPGRGSTFRVLLPEGTGVPARPAPPDPGPVPRGSEAVLVVEDDDGVRRYVVGALRSLGYAVRAAASGEEALAIARERGPLDAVVADVVMPGLSGPELVKALAVERPGLAALHISGYPRIAAGNAAPPPGVVVLAKPFAPADLGRALRCALDGRADPARPAAAS